ncbi:MAG: TerC family protein [Rhodoferax sp.]|nr:TerC family protein [Rhodoferax sp.]
MDYYLSASFLAALAQIILIDIVLSGDNAVVIALAARNLPPHDKRRAILWGTGAAIGMRVLLTLVAVQLLKVPFLQGVGGVLLVWIAVKLLIQDEQKEGKLKPQDGLWAAIKTILIADVVMSLDNILAIAGVSKGDWVLLIFGLAMSIPLIVLGSTVLMQIMGRFPIVVYAGAALIAWTAGEMIDADKAIAPYLPAPLQGSAVLPLVLTAAVLAFGWWRKQRTKTDTTDKP